MKRIRLALLLLLIPLCCVAFAALTKTTSIVELDPWQEVELDTLRVGNAGDISDSYETILYLEIAYTDTDPQDGVEVSIEVSYGDDNWTLLTRPFTTPGGQAATTALDGIAAAGETVVSVDDDSNIDTNGSKWFIVGVSDDESETVRTKSAAANDVTICHDLLRTHSSGVEVWSIVHERIIPIPAAFAFVRVLINNTDSDAVIYFTTRISKVTSLN